MSKSLNTNCHSKILNNILGGVFIMKKVMVGMLILMVLLLTVGCLNYKAYGQKGDNNSIIQTEIADIGEQASQNAPQKNISAAGAGEKEVVLPSLNENKTNPEAEALEENLQTILVKENQLVKLKMRINDPNGDKVTYSFSKPLNNKGEWKTNYGDVGEYVVTVTATDGKLTTEKKFKISVTRVNVPPIIETLRDLIISEGDTIKVDPKITDPNHDPVTVTFSKPLDNNGAWKTDYRSSGEYAIKVSASDGELKTEKQFQLTVREVNLPPVITNLRNINAKEGELIKLEPVVTDEDKDEGENIVVRYGAPFSNDGTWTPNYTQHGTYNVNVTASDGRGGMAVVPITVTVEAVNMPPTIENITLEIS